MSDTWQDQNNRYLAASLEWLRARLATLLPPPVEAVPTVEVTPALETPEPKVWQRWFGTSAPVQEPKIRLLTPGQGPTPEDKVKSSTEEREKAAATDPPPALLQLAARFALSTFERDALLLCAAAEFDPGLTAIFAQVHGAPARGYPTFALALRALEDPAWESLASQRPLRYMHLIEIASSPSTPLSVSPLRADERIVNLLKGLNAVDDRLSSILEPVGSTHPVAPSQAKAVTSIVEQLSQAAAKGVVPVVQLIGNDASSRLAVAQQVCLSLERRLYRLGAEVLGAQATNVETLARLWQRESVLLPIALYIEADNVDANGAEIAAVSRFLTRESGLVFVGLQDPLSRLPGSAIRVDVEKPQSSEQWTAWQESLKAAFPDQKYGPVCDRLAGQFDLNFQEIDTVVAGLAGAAPETVEARAWRVSCELARPRLDSLGQRLEVKATWDDLVLPDEPTQLLRQIVGQVRERHKVYQQWGFAKRMNRGFGISALLAGESGTGKTMAAEVIANDLGLDLYRIDLSAVVSKYIGDIEKNIRKLFDAAEKGGAILFFDEADALFGKRSEVKESHDRYANIEINYLLQRMEAFSGLAILATNMKSALDPAFMRRLRFIVNFGFPGVQERKRIWQRALPPEVPSEALDYDRLARLSVTGGNVHSIALNAAFAAAQAGEQVTMKTMLAATRMEMRKLDKPVNEAELR